jgi:hypothetical protein
MAARNPDGAAQRIFLDDHLHAVAVGGYRLEKVVVVPRRAPPSGPDDSDRHKNSRS